MNHTQPDPTRPGYWIDARQPLPKPDEFTGSLNKTNEAGQLGDYGAEARKGKVDPVYKLAHDCGIPVQGAQMLVLMLADMQNQIDELKTAIQQLKAK